MKRAGDIREILAVVLLVSSAACRPKEPHPIDLPSTLATIGSAVISTSDFEQFAEQRLGASAETASAEVRSALFDQLVEERILAAASSPPTAAAPPNDPVILRESIEGFLSRAAASAAPVTDAEIEAAWRASPERFRLPERVRLRQLIVRTSAQASEAAKRHAAGERFESLSRTLSMAPNAARGGFVGVIARGQLPPEFETVVFRLPPGRLSAPVPAPSGVHLFLVESRESARQLSLDEARAPIRRDLEQSRTEEAVGRAVERALAAARVELAGEHFSFRYAGRWNGQTRSVAPPPGGASTAR